MNWRDLVAGWDENPDFHHAYAQAYPYHAVADAVVDLRAKAGWTQAELAKALGTTQSVVARLESGKQAVRIELLNRIADALGMTWRPVFEPRSVAAIATANIPSTIVLSYEINSFAWTGTVTTHLDTAPLKGLITTGDWFLTGEPLASSSPVMISSPYHVVEVKADKPEAPVTAGNRQSTLALAS